MTHTTQLRLYQRAEERKKYSKSSIIFSFFWTLQVKTRSPHTDKDQTFAGNSVIHFRLQLLIITDIHCVRVYHMLGTSHLRIRKVNQLFELDLR